MRKIIWVVPVLLALAGCDGMSQGQMFGTAGGAAIGAAVTPGNPVQGALLGGAVGLVAGTMMGRDAEGRCIYQRPNGNRYYAACP